MIRTNVITYGRVCNEDQNNNLNNINLIRQKEILKNYCDIRKYNNVKHYQEVCSGKNFDRPEWNTLMNYVEKNKNAIDVVLISEWSRLSRNGEKILAVVSKLSQMGILANSTEQPLDLTIADNKLMLQIYLTCSDAIFKPSKAFRDQINNINTHKEK